MSMKSRQMESIFTKLNVEKVDCKHHVKGYFRYDGSRIAPIYYSFGSKDIPAFVVKKIAKAMGLSDVELLKMSRCKISRDDYVKILQDRGWL